MWRKLNWKRPGPTQHSHHKYTKCESSRRYLMKLWNSNYWKHKTSYHVRMLWFVRYRSIAIIKNAKTFLLFSKSNAFKLFCCDCKSFFCEWSDCVAIPSHVLFRTEVPLFFRPDEFLTKLQALTFWWSKHDMI